MPCGTVECFNFSPWLGAFKSLCEQKRRSYKIDKKILFEGIKANLFAPSAMVLNLWAMGAF